MDSQVELNQVQEKRLATTAFYGYQRQKRVPDGYMTEDSNMTTDEYPCAAARPPRAEVTNEGDGMALVYSPVEGAPIVDAVPVGDGIAYLTAKDGDNNAHVFYENRHWTLADAQSTKSGRLLAFGNGLFCVESGRYIPDRNVSQDTPQPDPWPCLLASNVNVTASFGALLDNGEGMPVEPTPSSATAPSSPADGDRWYDETNHILKKYQSGNWEEVTPDDGEYRYDADNDAMYQYWNGEWEAVPTYNTFLADFSGSNVEALSNIREGAVVKLSSLSLKEGAIVTVVEKIYKDEVIIGGIPITAVALLVRARLRPTRGTVMTISREYPPIMHAVVHNNRIYGCAYYMAYGKTVNEIHVSRLGDPLSWDSYQGLEEDAFTFTVGEPGEWTGAATLAGNPVFFKEGCMVTVYGSGPSSYTSVTEKTDGVAKGSERSLCEIDGALYYHSPRGVMRLYAGGYPTCISDALARKNVWEDAVAGTDGRKYYVEMTDRRDRKRRLYVYDAVLGLWHIEDASGDGAVSFVRMRSELLAVRKQVEDGHDAVHLTYLSAPDWKDVTGFRTWLAGLRGTGPLAQLVPPWGDGYPTNVQKVVRQGGPVRWGFATCDYGHVGGTGASGTADAADYKRVKEIDVRYWKEDGAELYLLIQYDRRQKEGKADWGEPLPVSRFSDPAGTGRMRVRLRRCETYRLSLQGTGNVCIFSITQTYEEAGDRSGD